jgi:hypothetical protein
MLNGCHGSHGHLVTLVAMINHPLQMTSRAAPHHSEGSLSATRSERSSFLDGMDYPHVKIARLELWAGVSSALGSRTSGCGQRLAFCPLLIGYASTDALVGRECRGRPHCRPRQTGRRRIRRLQSVTAASRAPPIYEKHTSLTIGAQGSWLSFG